MKLLVFVLSLLLANVMVWNDSEIISALGAFSIIFIFSIERLSDTIEEKKLWRI